MGRLTMARHYVVKYFDGKTIVHADGNFQSGDVALCGNDLMGDATLGWHPAEETNKRITCEMCKRLVIYCKSISLKEFKSNG